MYKILAINPGSTSTKISIYNDKVEIYNKTFRHPENELTKYNSIIEQLDFRTDLIFECLKEAQLDETKINAVVGRGGLVKPIEGGTYLVNDELLNDLKEAKRGEHASNLGAIIADKIAKKIGAKAYIVDPVVVDEMINLARYSGHKDLERKSIFHALNQKAVAKRYSDSINKRYDKLNIIVAHLGGGISIGIHSDGKVIDVNNAFDGEGSFSPERSGSLPIGDFAKLCFSKKYSYEEIKKLLTGKGGIVSYLGVNSGIEVTKMIEEGNEKAKLIYDALAYQISKEIWANATVVSGKVDQIILTGGLAYSKYLVNEIIKRVNKISNVTVYEGEDEMIALTEGVLRVLNEEEKVKTYRSN